MAGRSGIVLPVAVLVVAVLGGGAALLLRGPEPEPEVDPYTQSRDCAEDLQVRHEGKVLCPDTRVEVFKFAGVMGPDKTGFDVEIVVEAGRTATVLGHAPSPVNGAPSVARLLFDAQDWRDPDGGLHALPAFEGTTHADHLRLLYD